jgi:large subunit ribosomal protein L18
MKSWKKIVNRTRRRALRIRKKVQGTEARPRLSVFRSNRYIYAQLIDDESGKTLAACSSLKLAKAGKLKAPYPGNRDAAKEVGTEIAGLAKDAGVTEVRFDRGPYKYHGRVQALAEAVRESGIVF